MSPNVAARQHRGLAVDRNCTVVSTSMRSPPDPDVEVGVVVVAAAAAAAAAAAYS